MMKRFLAIAIVVAGMAGLAGPAPAQTPAEREQTAAFVTAFQNPDGGFAPKVGQPSTLGSTSSAIRILGFVAGSIKDLPACIAYVQSCHDPATGGFAATKFVAEGRTLQPSASSFAVSNERTWRFSATRRSISAASSS